MLWDLGLQSMIRSPPRMQKGLEVVCYINEGIPDLCINFSKVVQLLEFMSFKVKSLSKDKACDYLGGIDVSLTPSLKVI